ncbi:MAG TPA: hypothetical protein VFS05_00280 [Gemmatimonadaceae bacterium]|nr:hypothetical protein [Gemmatimonadaceae bacterium]
MFSTCIFCHAPLGTNEVIEPFPIGRRLAFDARRGRLWVVCTACTRWNLTPLEERWEAIEECERRFRATTVRVSTDHIGLARLGEGLELVRIGEPLRPEFAAWRYGGQFGRRRRRALAAAGARAAAYTAAGVVLAPVWVPLAVISIVIPGSFTILGPAPLSAYFVAREYLEWERVAAVVRLEGSAAPLKVRRRHLHGTRLLVDPGDQSLRLDLVHEHGVARLSGTAAARTAGVLLAHSNRAGAPAGEVRDAVRRIEDAGDSHRFLTRATRISDRRFATAMLAYHREVGALGLSDVERLAVEMAVHEETERQAMEGELRLLEDAWREAEEIASIADGLLLPSIVEDVMERLRRGRES